MSDIQATITHFENKLQQGVSRCRIKHYKTAIAAMKELQEYKALEASGRLMKLPCAIGDTVYEIIHDDIPVPCDYICKYEVEDVSVKAVKYAGDWLGFDEMQDVYFTREEAEARLRELATGNIGRI